MIANYHAHTLRCGHAELTERYTVEAALEKGLKICGFSEHVPFFTPTGKEISTHMPVNLIEDYFRSLTGLQEEYRGKIEIPIGFECEYFPDVHEETIARLAGYPLDYLILGQHAVDAEYECGVFGGTTDDGFLRAHTELMIAGIKTGRYSYVAHPDVFRFEGSDAIYERTMGELCETAKALHIPLEYNILGAAGHRHYPCDRFFRLAGEVGNEVVLGGDWHYAWQLEQFDLIAEAERHLTEDLKITPLQTVTLRNPFASAKKE